MSKEKLNNVYRLSVNVIYCLQRCYPIGPNMRNHKIKHPGEVLRDGFLLKFNMNPHRLSLKLRLPASRVNEIVQGRRGITAETAIRFARFFGTTAEYWLELQAKYDLANIDPAVRARVEDEVPANFLEMQPDTSSDIDKT